MLVGRGPMCPPAVGGHADAGRHTCVPDPAFRGNQQRADTLVRAPSASARLRAQRQRALFVVRSIRLADIEQRPLVGLLQDRCERRQLERHASSIAQQHDPAIGERGAEAVGVGPAQPLACAPSMSAIASAALTRSTGTLSPIAGAASATTSRGNVAASPASSTWPRASSSTA